MKQSESSHTCIHRMLARACTCCLQVHDKLHVTRPSALLSLFPGSHCTCTVKLFMSSFLCNAVLSLYRMNHVQMNGQLNIFQCRSMIKHFKNNFIMLFKKNDQSQTFGLKWACSTISRYFIATYG